MSSLDDSKLTNIKLDDTHDASSPISASPQIENVFLNDKNVPIEQNQNESSLNAHSNPNPENDLADINNENYIHLFSSLFSDQINAQDVNAILESQKQT
jgi:hypothetical protein